MYRFILISLIAFNCSAGSIDEIKKDCASKWPSDYKMQSYCSDKQIASWDKVLQYTRTHPGMIERDIAIECFGKWVIDISRQAFDYSMVEYCTKNQTAAYDSLHPEKMIDVLK